MMPPQRELDGPAHFHFHDRSCHFGMTIEDKLDHKTQFMCVGIFLKNRAYVKVTKNVQPLRESPRAELLQIHPNDFHEQPQQNQIQAAVGCRQGIECGLMVSGRC